jgi:hypothetical protein
MTTKESGAEHLVVGMRNSYVRRRTDGADSAAAGAQRQLVCQRRPTDQRQRVRVAMSSSLEPTPEQFATLAARPADARS